MYRFVSVRDIHPTRFDIFGKFAAQYPGPDHWLTICNVLDGNYIYFPLCWILTRAPIHGILINIPGGILQVGFNLASFNFLLSLAPSEKRALYAALCQVAVASSSAAGKFLGSLIVTQWGCYLIFALSRIGRFIGILYFWRFVHAKAEPRGII